MWEKAGPAFVVMSKSFLAPTPLNYAVFVNKMLCYLTTRNQLLSILIIPKFTIIMKHTSFVFLLVI
jgi:hypothetical protein